jgi:chemotaxis protein methyltransferase CheR
MNKGINLVEDEGSDLEDLEIGLLLEGIYAHYGYDFRDYNRSSIRRRVWNRIRAENLRSISGLQEKVLHDTHCMDRLLSDFSITVTEMFRDPPFFRSFRTKVVPLLHDCSLLRIWHAGCATGEEVYSMAILLKEEGLYDRTIIYATDMNASALDQAKSGIVLLDKMQSNTRSIRLAWNNSRTRFCKTSLKYIKTFRQIMAWNSLKELSTARLC